MAFGHYQMTLAELKEEKERLEGFRWGSPVPTPDEARDLDERIQDLVHLIIYRELEVQA